jgi:hypothetical protein
VVKAAHVRLLGGRWTGETGPQGPPWWLGVLLAIVITGVCVAPVWVPIVWRMVVR